MASILRMAETRFSTYRHALETTLSITEFSSGSLMCPVSSHCYRWETCRLDDTNSPHTPLDSCLYFRLSHIQLWRYVSGEIYLSWSIKCAHGYLQYKCSIVKAPYQLVQKPTLKGIKIDKKGLHNVYKSRRRQMLELRWQTHGKAYTEAHGPGEEYL